MGGVSRLRLSQFRHSPPEHVFIHLTSVSSEPLPLRVRMRKPTALAPSAKGVPSGTGLGAKQRRLGWHWTVELVGVWGRRACLHRAEHRRVQPPRGRIHSPAAGRETKMAPLGGCWGPSLRLDQPGTRESKPLLALLRLVYYSWTCADRLGRVRTGGPACPRQFDKTPPLRPGRPRQTNGSMPPLRLGSCCALRRTTFARPRRR